jgi:hypothetical protein
MVGGLEDLGVMANRKIIEQNKLLSLIISILISIVFLKVAMLRYFKQIQQNFCNYQQICKKKDKKSNTE